MPSRCSTATAPPKPASRPQSFPLSALVHPTMPLTPSPPASTSAARCRVPCALAGRRSQARRRWFGQRWTAAAAAGLAAPAALRLAQRDGGDDEGAQRVGPPPAQRGVEAEREKEHAGERRAEHVLGALA